MKKSYTGPNGTIHFDGSKCIHTRMCVMNLPHMFVANAPGDWIKPEGASTTQLVEAAHNCASGAISVTLANGETEDNPAVNAIYVRENGPLAVRAEIQIDGEDIGKRATLCRCGKSNNKPYCDGAHVKAHFTATGEPATTPSDPLENKNGPLNITPQKNGPLKVAGNVEICSGTARSTKTTQMAFMCRCGESMNKPYCDGSHSKVGFEASGA